MKITVAYSPAPKNVRQWEIELPAVSRLSDALEGCGIYDEFPVLASKAASASLELGIWGKGATPDSPLTDGDRVEIYRDLVADPKVARRERFKKQGAKSAGLFAKRRAGAKAGY